MAIRMMTITRIRPTSADRFLENVLHARCRCETIAMDEPSIAAVAGCDAIATASSAGRPTCRRCQR